MRRVSNGARAAYIASVRADASMVSEGYPYFDIWPPGEREEYFVYEYLESFLPSVPTFGYDVGSEPPANSTSKPLQAAA